MWAKSKAITHKAKCCPPRHGKVGSIPHSISYTTSTSTFYEMTGEFFSASDLFTVDEKTGTATLVGPTGTVNFLATSIDPSDHNMYAINTFPGSPNISYLYQIDKTTGTATFIDQVTGLLFSHEVITDMAFTPGGLLFVISIVPGSPGVNVYIMPDLSTGGLSYLGTIGTTDRLIEASIAFGPYDIFITTTNTRFVSNLYTDFSLSGTISYSGFPRGALVRPVISGLVYDVSNATMYASVVNDLRSNNNTFLLTLNTSTAVAINVGPTATRTSALAVDTVFATKLVVVPDPPGVKIDMGPCCG